MQELKIGHGEASLRFAAFGAEDQGSKIHACERSLVGHISADKTCDLNGHRVRGPRPRCRTFSMGRPPGSLPELSESQVASLPLNLLRSSRKSRQIVVKDCGAYHVRSEIADS